MQMSYVSLICIFARHLGNAIFIAEVISIARLKLRFNTYMSTRVCIIDQITDLSHCSVSSFNYTITG